MGETFFEFHDRYEPREMIAMLGGYRDYLTTQKNDIVNGRDAEIDNLQSFYDTWPHRDEDGCPVPNPCVRDLDKKREFMRKTSYYNIGALQSFVFGFGFGRRRVTEQGLYILANTPKEPSNFLAAVLQNIRKGAAKSLLAQERLLADRGEFHIKTKHLEAGYLRAFDAYWKLKEHKPDERVEKLNKRIKAYDAVLKAAHVLVDAKLDRVSLKKNGPLARVLSEISKNDHIHVHAVFGEKATDELNLRAQQELGRKLPQAPARDAAPGQRATWLEKTFGPSRAKGRVFLVQPEVAVSRAPA